MRQGAPERSAKQHLSLFIKGLMMGAADVVPGVSGGTVAFISGIYEELIDSLKRVEPSLLGTLIESGPVTVWKKINGNFLLAVFSGVLVSIFSLAKFIALALQNYPILVWAFFFGLVLASAVLLWRQLEAKRWVHYLCVLIGAVLAFVVSKLTPAVVEVTYLKLFLAGAVAVCAMILPGVSGGFLLLMMGLYGTIIEAIRSFDIASIACVGGGAVIGLLAFSHLLSWLLQRFHNQTLALLTGFLFGSLSLIWPWKQTLESYVNSHGDEVPLIQQNVLPWKYEALMNNPSELGLACLFCVIGLLIVMLLEKKGGEAQNN